MKKSALITGATGFIGSHLMSHLVSNGWSVTALVRKSASPRGFAYPGGVEVVFDDAADADGSMLSNELARVKPDVVFHLASLFLAAHTPADIPNLVESNVLFGTRLLDAMTRAGLTRFVNTGTAWQYYQDKMENPVNLYAATKSAFDSIVDYYHEAAGLSTITLKLYDTYGAHDPRAKLVHLLTKAAASGEHLAMSAGGQKIDLVHVDDVVRAFALAGERLLAAAKPLHESFTVSSGDPLSLRELVGIFEKATGTKVNVGWGERPYREREVMIPFTKIVSIPGWAPKIKLEDGLRAVYAASRDEPKLK
jgi:nucleoside-diphosphate-sugar epimerase